MSRSVQLRSAEPADTALLRLLIREAAFWRVDQELPTVELALANPAVARYVENFGRPGDAGVVAMVDGLPIGAAWWRYFPADAPGYGFVDQSVPEVSIAVLRGHRGKGVGTQLLDELRRMAHAQGVPRLSLSVERDNAAYALYVRLGFQPVGQGEGAQTMVLDTEPS